MDVCIFHAFLLGICMYVRARIVALKMTSWFWSELTSSWLFLNLVDNFIRHAQILDVISSDVTFWDLPELIAILKAKIVKKALQHA